jgi:hypothetical protein
MAGVVSEEQFMSRVAFLAAAMVAALVVPAAADESVASGFGLPIAPNGGKASIHQWGALDDAFAVNPDGDDAPAKPTHKFAPMVQDQEDQSGDDPGDPDPDHAGEVLPV